MMLQLKKIIAFIVSAAIILINTANVFAYDTANSTVYTEQSEKLWYNSDFESVNESLDRKIEQNESSISLLESGESLITEESVLEASFNDMSSSMKSIKKSQESSQKRIMVKYNEVSDYNIIDNGIDSQTGIQTHSISNLKNGTINIISGTDIQLSKIDKSVFSDIEEDFIVKSAAYDSISWNIEEIDYDYSVENSLSGEGVKIAVLDTGINPKYVSISGGISFVEGVESYNDDNGHGTTVAGIINGSTYYGNQIGLDLNASLYSVKVLNSDGEGYYSNVIAALNWCVENDMDIAVMGFEGEYDSKFFSDAISYAFESGILLIAPSGNGGKSELSYPARFDEVLSVGATGEDNTRAFFSNYGIGLDLVAPGKDIPSVRNIFKSSGSYDGTSFAAAHVAGIAAMLLKCNSDLSNVELITALCHGCNPLGNKEECGSGVINVSQLFSWMESKSNSENSSAFVASINVSSNSLVINRGDAVTQMGKTFVGSMPTEQGIFYEVELEWGDVLDVKLTVPENCDYDLTLYNCDMKYLSSSNNHGSEDEYLIKEIKNRYDAGIYYLCITSYCNDIPGEYSLTVTIDTPYTRISSNTVDKVYYDSGVNVLSDSIVDDLGNISSDNPFEYANVEVYGAQEIWFSVNVDANNAGNYTSIILKNLSTDMDLCLFETQEYEDSLYISGSQGLGDEQINYHFTDSGTYYIMVLVRGSSDKTQSFTVEIYYEQILDLEFNMSTNGYATANWTTVVDSNSIVKYRSETATSYSTNRDDSYVTDHSIEIRDLSPMTKHYASVLSVAQDGNEETPLISPEKSFYTGDVFEVLGDNCVSIQHTCKKVTGTMWKINPNAIDYDGYTISIPDYGELSLELISPAGYEYNLAIVYENETYYVGNKIQYFVEPGDHTFFICNIGPCSPTDEYKVKIQYMQYVYSVEELRYGGNGVYTPTGNFNETYTDILSYDEDKTGRVARTYNSKDSFDSHFGRGWSFSFEGSVKDLERKFLENIGTIVTKTDTKVKTVRFGDGTTALFELQSDNITYKALDSRNELVKNSDGTYTLTTPQNAVYGYNTDGYLTSIKDKNGNETVITVDENGKVIGVTDERGRTYTVLYGENGYVSAIIDNASGRSATYQYDASKNLISATDSAGNVDNYTYYTSGNKAGYLYQVKDSYGNVLVELDYDTTANGSYPISNMTDEFGTEYAYTYSDENKVTTITEVVENGTPRVTSQAYDDKKFVTTETFPDGKKEVTEYHLVDGENKYGEVAKITDRNGNVTEYERDDNGNVIKIVNPDGTTSEALYDDKNNVVWTLDETGVFTRYTYDDYKINLLKQSVYLEKLASDDTKPELTDSNTDDFITVQYSYADLPYKGLVSSITDGNGNTTSYTYDSSYNLETVTNPESNTEEPIVTRYEYNTMGLKSAEISPAGNRTEYQYDNNGKITQKKVITDGGAEITQYLYDLNGNIITEKAPNQVEQNGNGVVYTYYPSGKLHTKTDAAGYVYTYTYDKYGNISSIANPDGSINLYEYDSVNRQIAERLKESANSTAVLISETSYAVSDNNEIVTIKKYIDDINYLTDISVYDYDGKLVSHSANGIVDETNIYYGNRLLKNSTDGNGNDVHYTYFNHDSSTDELYDEKWIEVSDGLYFYEKVVYDLAGNVTKILKSTSPVALNTVPSQNLIIEEYQYYKDNLLKQATDNEGRKVIYTYDANRHMSGAEQYYSNTGKNVVKVAYDHNGKLLSQKAYVDGDYVGNTSSDSLGEYIEQTYSYDGNGNVSSETSPAGHTVTYTYDGNNRKLASSEQGTDENDALVTVTNTWQYDYRDKVVSQTDAKGNVTKYIYDKFGNLVYSIDASSGVTFAIYDRLGRITAKVTPENYTGTVTLGNATLDSYETDVVALSSMNRTEYTYNPVGLVLSETDIFTDPITNESVSIVKSYTYDNNGNILTETDGMGYVTTYTYNGLNKCVSILDAEGDYRNLPYSVSYEYDALGRMTAERKYNSSELEYTYNNAGKIKTVRAKKDGTFFVQQEYTYDLADNMISAKDGNGNEKTYTYNALGLVQSETLPSDSSIASKTTTYYYDGNGNITKTVDTTGKEVINTYNFKNLPVTTVERKTDGTESVTNTLRYDVNGNPCFSTDGNGNIKVIIYDALNRPISETVTGTSYAKITAYDKNGNILSETDGFGNTTSYQYDPINRLVEVYDANGTVVETLAYNANHTQTTSENALGNVTTFAYDRNNRLVSTTDPLGHTESNVYDDAGNISAKKDGNLNVTSYTYDELGNLKSTSQAIGEQNILISFTYDNNGNLLTQKNGNDHLFTFIYNSNNLVSSKYDHEGLGVAAKTETYSYDGNGNMISQTDKNGITTTFSYDVHGNQTGSSASDVSVTKTYDSNGNVLSMTDNSGVTSYTYDALNRVLTKNVSGVGTLTYQYDITDGLESGYFAEKQTDSKGNVVTKVYDKNCRIYQIKDGDVVSATHTYNADGSLEKILYANGMGEYYSYYADNTLHTLTTKKSDDTIVDTYSYTYDAAGNQTSKTETVDGVLLGTIEYTYDSANRLSTVTEPTGKVTAYTYDGAGNRITETVTLGEETVTTVYSYNEQERLISKVEESQNRTKTTTYCYDNNGNQYSSSVEWLETADYIPSGLDLVILGVSDDSALGEINEFNSQNQIAVTYVGDKTIRFSYNGDGIRVGKNVNGNIEKYLYDTGNHVVLEVNGDGGQIAENIYGIYNVARVVDGESYTYLHNGHGDVVALIDSEENAVNRYTYDAFGVILTSTETVENPFRYAGYWYDSETGLYYLMARYYNPVNGRFLSEDPARDGYNWYVYCDNDPIMYYDYSGEVAIPAAIITGIAIVTKIIDYAWTAWDVIDSTRILADDNEDPFEKVFAAINIVLAVGTEAIEPDEWLPINIPLDDAGRKIALSTLKQKYKNDGPVAVKNYLRKHFGNKMDDAIKKIDDAIDLSVSRTGKWTKGSYDSAKDSLIDHYYRHGAEVGATDVDSYLRKAEGFASNLKNATKHRGLDGFTEGAVRYEKNGKYIILDANKNILSYGVVR